MSQFIAGLTKNYNNNDNLVFFDKLVFLANSDEERTWGFCNTGDFALIEFLDHELDEDVLYDPAKLMDAQLRDKIAIVDNNPIRGFKIIKIFDYGVVIIEDPRLERSRLTIQCSQQRIQNVMNSNNFHKPTNAIVTSCQYAYDGCGWLYLIDSETNKAIL